MTTCNAWRLTAIPLVAILVCMALPAEALTLTTSSGPLIKTELFRGGSVSSALSPGSIWGELAFDFAIPANAIGDGEFHVFAGGDLNNIGARLDRRDGRPLRRPHGARHLRVSDRRRALHRLRETAAHQHVAVPDPGDRAGGMFANPSSDSGGRRAGTPRHDDVQCRHSRPYRAAGDAGGRYQPADQPVSAQPDLRPVHRPPGTEVSHSGVTDPRTDDDELSSHSGWLPLFVFAAHRQRG